ncbi:hypothetical protein BD779DRAFT_1535043 [Infundibulicybe gibba]|nr:hypothetical protein BD779DRAFT_1535043 [Infundibulicybe gibba]
MIGSSITTSRLALIINAATQFTQSLLPVVLWQLLEHRSMKFLHLTPSSNIVAPHGFLHV